MWLNIVRLPKTYAGKCTKKWVGVEWGSVNLMLSIGCSANPHFYFYVEDDTIQEVEQ